VNYEEHTSLNAPSNFITLIGQTHTVSKVGLLSLRQRKFEYLAGWKCQLGGAPEWRAQLNYSYGKSLLKRVAYFLHTWKSIIIEHIVAQTIPSISLWSRLQMPFPMNKDKYRANNRSSSSQINVCIMG
jgi:hypothetical protein